MMPRQDAYARDAYAATRLSGFTRASCALMRALSAVDMPVLHVHAFSFMLMLST